MQLRWPRVLVAIILVLVIAICVRQTDHLLVTQMKAMISVMFGFASSCLLLSLIWLMQQRPADATWSMHNSPHLDVPSMNPMGGSDHRRATICTISSMDKPPDYDEALTNSKPIHEYWMHKKSTSSSTFNICQCGKQDYAKPQASSANINDSDAEFCNICMNQLISHRFIHKYDPPQQQTLLVAQIAKSLVRGFSDNPESTASGADLQQVYVVHTNTTNTNNIQPHRGYNQQHHQNDTWKPTYCQLDVDQLMMANESPPKYNELLMPPEKPPNQQRRSSSNN